MLSTLKVLNLIPGMPKPVTETEVNNFLESKLNIQIATIDEEGYAVIHPTWFVYNKESGKLYTGTQKMTKKFRISGEILTRYIFSIDDENFPYKGVKGRAAQRRYLKIYKRTCQSWKR